MAFVRTAYGHGACDTVSMSLPPAAARVFARAIAEGGWYPLDAFVEYLRAAKRCLGSGETDFFRRLGRYAGARQRPVMGSLVATREMSMKMAPTIWRMSYDVGRLVMVGDGPGSAVSQIYDFPTTAELCERFLGSFEGVATTPELPARTLHTQCTLRGNPCCEFKLVFGAEALAG